MESQIRAGPGKWQLRWPCDVSQLSPSPFPLPSREGIEKPSPLAGEGRMRGHPWSRYSPIFAPIGVLERTDPFPCGCHCWLAQQCKHRKHCWASQQWHPSGQTHRSAPTEAYQLESEFALPVRKRIGFKGSETVSACR
jgi:hypothetical protein